MSAATVDVAQNRAVKAHTLALFAWRHGIAASTLFALTGKQRDAMARAAGVNPPSTGSPTWGMVFGRLEAMAAAADDPRAPARDLAGEDHWWKTVEPVTWPEVAPVPAASVQEPAVDDHLAQDIVQQPAVSLKSAVVTAAYESWNATPAPPELAAPEPPSAPTARPARPAPPHEPEPLDLEPAAPAPTPPTYDEPGPVPPDAPPGWAAMVEAYDGDPLPMLCRSCAAAAIVNTPDGPACRAHPPEWGRALDWTPRPGRSCTPRQCSCGRCPAYRPIPRSVPVTDPEWRYTK